MTKQQILQWLRIHIIDRYNDYMKIVVVDYFVSLCSIYFALRMTEILLLSMDHTSNIVPLCPEFRVVVHIGMFNTCIDYKKLVVVGTMSSLCSI